MDSIGDGQEGQQAAREATHSRTKVRDSKKSGKRSLGQKEAQAQITQYQKDHLVKRQAGTGVYFDETVAKGRVYFMLTLDKRFVKIGYTNNPKRRNRNLQPVSEGLFGCKAKMLGYFPGTTYTERWLHRKFEANREHGDWFHATPALLAYIDNLGLDSLQRKLHRATKTKTRKATRKVVNVTLDRDLLGQIEDFRYAHRLPSQVATILKLIQIGLLVSGKERQD